MDSLENYLAKVIDGVRTTDDKYASLMRPNLKTYPIPFFGDIKNARVLTVCVNPSATEFNAGRWPKNAVTADRLKKRLEGYFVPPQGEPPPHKWFLKWDQALEPLKVCYKSGAAHLDLSPRATASRLVTKADRELYDTMLGHDIQWFFKLLPECNQVRLLILAGCKMDKIMERCTAEKDGFEFRKQEVTKGEGRIGFYRLQGLDNFDRPVFYCSVSPSAWNPKLLIQRVVENQSRLLEDIGGAGLAL